jgi:hypothetical protein
MSTLTERIRHPLRTRDEHDNDADDEGRRDVDVVDRDEDDGNGRGDTAVLNRDEEIVGRDEAIVDRRREAYGGINWGAAFLGWLAAVGLGALLTALVSAAGAAIGLTEVSEAEAEANAETIGIVGGLGLIAVALIAYGAGGYVAGRMSRFDGGRQGFGVWVWAAIAAIVLAIAGGIAGTEYNLFAGIDLPRIPIDEGTLTAGGAITLAVIAIGTLLAAVLGGTAGERYHRKVDRAGYVD